MKARHIALTREAWLHSVATGLAPLFADAGHAELPPFRISCGFPSTKATARKNRAIGQCWDAEASEDKTHEILISPVLDDVMEIAGVVTHELCHACLPPGTGHKGKFPVLARKIGLEGKPTNTIPGDGFKARVAPLLRKVGDYPHARLNASSPAKKQGTRMIKCVCADCGYVVRTTAKWINNAGPPICPTCHEPFHVEA